MRERSIAVLVVTHNSERTLPALVDSLPAGMAGLDWSIVVVDNASSDRSVPIVRERLPDATLIEAAVNRGFAAGVNLAASAAERDSDLLILNHDVRLDPGSGAALIAALGPADGLEVGIAVPRLYDDDGALLPSLRREPTIRRAIAETFLGVRRAGRWGLGEAVLAEGAYASPTVADWGTGAALAISAECRAAAGPWDESFFLYSEECEFALRCRDRGFVTRLAPDAAVRHTGGASRRNSRLWTLLVMNKLRLYERRHGRALGAGFRLASLGRELRFAVGGNAPSRRAARALLGAAGLYGMSTFPGEDDD